MSTSIESNRHSQANVNLTTETFQRQQGTDSHGSDRTKT